MNTKDGMTDAKPDERQPLRQDLLAHGHAYDFFQAVSLLERLHSKSDTNSSDESVVRFASSPSMAFPASAIEKIEASDNAAAPTITVNFMGLTGPNGVLPRHYTQKIVDAERDLSGHGPSTLRAWFDLFTNRFVWSMVRAWQKMRIDRCRPNIDDPQTPHGSFVQGLLSLSGFGLPSTLNRLQFRKPSKPARECPAAADDRIADWALLRHTSVLARRRRSAGQISRVLSDYFQLPIQVVQFQGQWLDLDRECQTRLGYSDASSQLGIDAVVGRRVWSVESKLRIRVGPLRGDQFTSLLPDLTDRIERRRFVMLCQLARLLLGPEYDFDVQLILDHKSLSPVRLATANSDTDFYLGWNCWLGNKSSNQHHEEAIFHSIEATTADDADGQRQIA